MRALGYVRTAPGELGHPQLSPDHQGDQIAAACAERGWELVEVLSEIASLQDPPEARPVLRDAVRRVNRGDAGALVVAAADRVSLHLRWFGFLAGFRDRGRHFLALGDGWDTTTEGGAEAARLFGALGRQWRWYVMATEEPRWNGRNKVLARHIPPGSAVLDLGAGRQPLRDLLPEGCEYQPADIVDVPGTLFCDFNRGIWPAVTRRYDVVVASGVMEYLDDPRAFLRRLPELGDQVLFTHSLRGEERPGAAGGWPTHLSEPELHALFAELGLRWEPLDRWNAHGIYRLRAPAPGRSPMSRTSSKPSP